MAFDQVRNLFNSFLTFFSCVSKSAATDGESKRSPPRSRSAPPPSESTSTAVDADPVPQNSFISGTSTDHTPTVVPSRDQPAPPPSPSSVLSTGVDDDVSAPQIQNSTVTDDVLTVTPEPSVPETGCTPVIVPASVTDEVKSLTSVASAGSQEEMTVDEHELRSNGSTSSVLSTTADNIPVQQSFVEAETSTDTVLPPCDQPALPQSPRDTAANDVSARQDSLTTPISVDDLPTTTPESSAPEIGYMPVTVPGKVTDKLWSIMNLASTKPRPRRGEGKLTFIPPLFSEDDFGLRVLQMKVSLEMVTVCKESITGYIRVANLSHVKRVAVRYTMDKWKNSSDVEAEWIESVEDGEMDRFIFTLPAPEEPGELSFAIRYNDYWDNNEEKNYAVLFERDLHCMHL